MQHCKKTTFTYDTVRAPGSSAWSEAGSIPPELPGQELKLEKEDQSMNASLVVHRVGPDTAKNIEQMDLAITESAKAGAHLVLFSEAATTGLTLNNDPRHDLMLGEPIPGPAVTHFSQLARSSRIHIAFGILERDGAALFDTAVLVGPSGDILLKYRRIDPGWHSPTGDSRVYREGTACAAVDTAIGRFAFAICGDLFNDAVAEQVQEQHPTYLLMPFARHFDSGLYDQDGGI